MNERSTPFSENIHFKKISVQSDMHVHINADSFITLCTIPKFHIDLRGKIRIILVTMVRTVTLLPIFYYMLNFESFLMSWYCCKYEFEQCKIYTLPECFPNDIAKCRIADLENIEKEYSLLYAFLC